MTVAVLSRMEHNKRLSTPEYLNREIPNNPDSTFKAPADRATGRKRKAVKIETAQKCVEEAHKIVHDVPAECSVYAGFVTEKLRRTLTRQAMYKVVQI